MFLPIFSSPILNCQQCQLSDGCATHTQGALKNPLFHLPYCPVPTNDKTSG